MAAQADIARTDALLADEALYAPFSGIVTNINTVVGEITTDTVVTLVANDSFTLVARIPEIDIRNLSPGQSALISFDAATDDVLSATLEYISPVAILIDGVSYFEANLRLSEERDWFRDGLNADIDIVIDEMEDTLRVANRYIFDTADGKAVRIQDGDVIATTTITVVLEGSDGFSAVTGLSEGDTLVVPE
jgi:HlyD family secretion protein